VHWIRVQLAMDFSLRGFEFIEIKVVVEGTMKAGLIR
jgi:hypothetical protein